MSMILRNLLRTRHLSRYFSCSSTSKMLSTTLSTNEVSVEVLEEADSGVIVFGLNRPSARNALGSSLTSSLMNAVEKIHLDQNARVVVLRSLVPGVFCAGADLKERIKLSNHEVSVMVGRLSALATAIENIPIPTIAAIDGSAFGGGLEIALACDMIVVSENAKLGLVETKLAILPAAGGTQRLTRLINPAVAKELIYCARIFNGSEAKDFGLANHSVKQNSSSDAAFQKALDISRQIIVNGPLGVKMAKLAINKGLQTDIQTGCKIEQLCYAQVIPTKDRIEGLKAFKENRAPNYKGE
ncbi:methylglutaconyl-CoA hydratase, mitochondrial-like [Macrosteles quadrilineatus]|uniref:methylglutaconyl-CoA hydratase, mitochondrial-like n=1 Tax=Macrosteles quadrilineatus TaxID=74068 RepID=UPI0023E10EC2|nr:methylglutaconyl-CoA hydratase, mitochondrial-like [Macrosteles quadrilineatus]XP_054289415.1 methylglutaconyl-CoA hydratase, mitochondrial-like [Macrosteles quadrilineatus]